MPRNAAKTTSANADDYDGPAKHTRGAVKVVTAAAAPIAAPAPAAALSQSPIHTRVTRCAGTVRAAVKKQTKAATRTKPERKPTSLRKPSAAPKSADAPSRTKARVARATRIATNGNTLPTTVRQTRKQPMCEAKANDMPPFASRVRKGIKPVAAVPLPTNPKIPTRYSKKPNLLAANAYIATASNFQPLPSREERAFAPSISTGFKVVAPWPDTPAPSDNISTPACRRANFASEQKVRRIIHNLEEVPQDPDDTKHLGNEIVTPAVNGASAIVEALNYPGKAHDWALPRREGRATGKARAKSNTAKEKIMPSLSSRKALATQAAAVASSSRALPLPHRPMGNVSPLLYRLNGLPPGSQQAPAKTGVPASGQQQPLVQIKVEEQTNDAYTSSDDESAEDQLTRERERLRLREWYETLPERHTRTSNWVASVNERRRYPGKRRREDQNEEVAPSNSQDDEGVTRLAKRRMIGVGERRYQG